MVIHKNCMELGLVHQWELCLGPCGTLLKAIGGFLSLSGSQMVGRTWNMDATLPDAICKPRHETLHPYQQEEWLGDVPCFRLPHHHLDAATFSSVARIWGHTFL